MPGVPGARAQELAATLARGAPGRELLLRILATSDADELEAVRNAAEQALLHNCGDTVRLEAAGERAEAALAAAVGVLARRDDP